MDSITHIALGAVIGETLGGKALGKRAMLIGAVAQSLPDIDGIASFWLEPAAELLAHRGFTHSFLFAGIAAVLLGFVLSRLSWTKNMSIRQWIFFLAIQIITHILLDTCNAYGVGWLEPFNTTRIAFHTLFVADPLFSISVILAAILLLVLRSENQSRLLFAKISLSVCVLYILYSFYNKHTIDKDIKNILSVKSIQHKRFLSTPTPLNTWLWFVAIESDSGFHVGHRSVFDNLNDMDLYYFPRNEKALAKIDNQEMVQDLIRFSEGYYTVENRNDTLQFNDLRFGQITGWATPEAPFVFHFYLEYPEENKYVIQRGRFANWNKETIRIFFEKIKGSNSH